MVFTIPEQTSLVSKGPIRDYKYITNWLECHLAGGEYIDSKVTYSRDLALSLVLSYLAPFSVSCVSSERAGIVKETAPPLTEEKAQTILAITLIAFMTLSKPVTPQNTPAYPKRWKAALASQNMADLIKDTTWTSILNIVGRFTPVVQTRADLRREITERMLTLKKEGLEGAILSQIKLVWEYSALKSVQYMEIFINSHCRALEIPAVLDQALILRERWTAAQRTDPGLAYSRVRDPNSHSELNYSHFPDLYYAAITHAKHTKIVGDNFTLSTSSPPTHATLIDKYIKKTTALELGALSEEAKEKLTKIGYPVVRRRRHESTDSEADEEEPERRPRKTRRH